MTRFLKLVGAVSCLGFLAGCASDDVIVLPAADGHIGGVVVEKNGSKVILDKPYAESKGGGQAETADAQQVNADFATTLAARPIPPKSYTLYFVENSDQLVPSSRATFEDIFKEISRRKASEIVVTGHTDTMGTLEYNDALSLARAKSVVKLFTDRGLPASSVIPVGRGERELLIKTKDNVPEPRNRRVVITVR